MAQELEKRSSSAARSAVATPRSFGRTEIQKDTKELAADIRWSPLNFGPYRRRAGDGKERRVNINQFVNRR
jgi:hypothetical protein